jgi:hypothetical protein
LAALLPPSVACRGDVVGGDDGATPDRPGCTIDPPAGAEAWAASPDAFDGAGSLPAPNPAIDSLASVNACKRTS